MKLKLPENVKVSEEFMQTKNNIFAFGEIELEENDKSQRVLMNIEYLINGFSSLQRIGFEYVALRVETDKPLFITDDGKNGNKLKGMIIAPRIYD